MTRPMKGGDYLARSFKDWPIFTPHRLFTGISSQKTFSLISIIMFESAILDLQGLANRNQQSKL